MSEKLPYLSDEELQKLMDSAQEDIVDAPKSLENDVFNKIEQRRRKKNIAFWEYCARIGFGVVAAIALLFIIPSFSLLKPEVPSRDEVMNRMHSAGDRQEVLSQLNKSGTRDEVLNKKSLMEQLNDYISKNINPIIH